MSKTAASGQEGIDVSNRSIKDAEHFEFAVPASGVVAVTNQRHDEPTTYAVNVSESRETSACSCPADEYQPGPCKHRQAVESTPAVVLAASATDTERRA